MKKILLIIAITLCIFQMVALATVIDIGSPAINRDSLYMDGYTIIDLSNPADGTGTITQIEIYFSSIGDDAEGVEVATFYEGETGYFTTRDSALLGTVTKGSKQTFPVDISVVTGDYIGIFVSTSTDGYIETDGAGGSGMWEKLGDYIPCSNEEFPDFYADDRMSVYGTGETVAVGIKWNGVTITKWNGITITIPLNTQ